MNNKDKENSNPILFDLDATRAFVGAVDKLSRAVCKTMGPSGSCVMIDQGYNKVRVTKDGVTVAKALSSPDKFENMAIQLIKEVCVKANSIVGDGTTSAIVIVSEIIKEGFKRLSAGYPAKHLTMGMEKALEEVRKIVEEQSYTPSPEDVMHVATISANNDKVLGSLIFKAVSKINGKYGQINVEESKSTETELEFTEGIKINKGYMSPYFVQQNDNVEFEDVQILITNGKITDQEFVLKFLEHIAVSNKAGLIICDELDKQILGTLVLNSYKGIVKVVAIKAPEFGDSRLQALSDIAIVTGGKVIDGEAVNAFRTFHPEYLGSCRRIIVTKDTTSIVDGHGDKDVIKQKITELQEKMDSAKGEMSDYEFDKLQESYSKLTGGVAIIKVGASTESELNEKKDRVIDSVSAVKATYDQGVSMGGGLAAYNAYKTFIQRNIISTFNEREREGARLLLEALKSPMKQILINGNFDVAVIMQKILDSSDLENGFDANIGEFCNMRERGIIDSTKSVMTSLSVAVSIGKIALNSQVFLSVDVKDDRG